MTSRFVSVTFSDLGVWPRESRLIPSEALPSTAMSTATSREDTLYVMVRWGDLKTALAYAAGGVPSESGEFETTGSSDESRDEIATVRPVHGGRSTPVGRA